MKKNLTSFELPSDQQLVAVWDKVDKMQPGERIIINSAAPNFPELLVKSLKMWMDCFKGGEFNSDYSVFRKMDIAEYLNYKAG
ncbi:MAG: hypothetical protein WC380_00180 [Pedobacter sp.]|jgi:hypothetical protein